MSVEKAVDTMYGDSLTEKEKEEEVKRLKEEQRNNRKRWTISILGGGVGGKRVWCKKSNRGNRARFNY